MPLHELLELVQRLFPNVVVGASEKGRVVFEFQNDRRSTYLAFGLLDFFDIDVWQIERFKLEVCFWRKEST